jgi:hypothetical protein
MMSHHAGWLFDTMTRGVIYDSIHHLTRGMSLLSVLALCAIVVAAYLVLRT